MIWKDISAMKETDYLEGNTKLIADLQKIDVFEPFETEELQKLLTMSKLRVYQSGETIVQEGNTDSWVYFLVYGKVRIVKQNSEVAVLKRRGDVFGEMSFIDNTPRSASAVADGDSVCLSLDTAYVNKLAGDDRVAFGYILYRVFSEILAQRLKAATEELLQLKGKSGIQFFK
jgi:CRP/FNR family cyclic AMP-dependent transcriptional regulator